MKNLLINYIKRNQEASLVWQRYGMDKPQMMIGKRRYNTSRYHILNLHPLLSSRQQSIEYRCFNSTLHAGEIKAYIQFSLLLTASALNAKSASRKVTVLTTANDKYAFRV